MEQTEQLFLQASQAINAGRFDQAETLLSQALEFDGNLAEVHANLAWLLDRRGAFEDAIQHYLAALERQPLNAQIHLNLGAVLAQTRYHQAAESAYRKALGIDSSMAGAWSNLGCLQALTFRDEEAEQSLRTALHVNASHAGAHFNLACLLLRKGRLEEGWRHLESRDCYKAIEQRLNFPRWQAQPLSGLSVFVVYEAGHGDMIQFCRYVTALAMAGALRVDLLCHPALKLLLQSLQGVGQVIGLDENLPAIDWHCWVPVMSLPFHFGTQIDTIPAQLPYLHVPPDQLSLWQERINAQCPGPLLRVGLVWHGNPDFVNDAQRSLPSLRTLAPLWTVSGVQFFSLQKGRGEQELVDCQLAQPLVDVAPLLNNFADTAAAIEQLDLVISVDTAVAHLAGALGKPCWVLLPSYMTDWRWLEERCDSPWYPNVLRLFRQSPHDDWSTVVGDVREALQCFSNQLVSR